MVSHPLPSAYTLAIKFGLIALLAFAILFLDSAPPTEACGNQSCSGGACSESANTTCVWKTRSDGSVYCVTVNCSSSVGGEGSDY